MSSILVRIAVMAAALVFFPFGDAQAPPTAAPASLEEVSCAYAECIWWTFDEWDSEFLDYVDYFEDQGKVTFEDPALERYGYKSSLKFSKAEKKMAKGDIIGSLQMLKRANYWLERLRNEGDYRAGNVAFEAGGGGCAYVFLEKLIIYLSNSGMASQEFLNGEPTELLEAAYQGFFLEMTEIMETGGRRLYGGV